MLDHVHTESDLEFWNGAQGLDGGVHVASIPEVPKSNWFGELLAFNRRRYTHEFTHCFSKLGIVHIYRLISE
jgi:hypothetical protein